MDKERFCKLFIPCEKPLKKFAYSIASSAPQAEEIISETVFHSYKNINKLKNDATFLSYLFTIASRVKNKLILAEKKFNREIEPDTLISESLSPEEQYDVKILHKAISKLRDKEKEAIILFSFSGLSIKEIAEVQETTTYNVKIRIHRAKLSLKKLLA